MLDDRSTIATVDHDEIKSWAEASDRRPVQVRDYTGENLYDRLRFRFPDERHPGEEDLSWDTFFDIFDREKLEFLYEDIADEAVEDGNLYQFRPRKLG